MGGDAAFGQKAGRVRTGRALCSVVWAAAVAGIVFVLVPVAGHTASSSRSDMPGGWRFVSTHNPSGGPDAVSIMHTADTSRSDADFAGIMIRCREGHAQLVIISINPFPLTAHPKVIFGAPGREIRFDASVTVPGTAILVAADAATLVGGPWQLLETLEARVEDGASILRGTVDLSGLPSAFKILMANCPLS